MTRRVSCCLGGFLHLLVSGLGAQDPPVATSPSRLVILHTNDLHGQIRPMLVVSRPGVERKMGGFPALEAYVRRARAEARAGKTRLWLTDGGDWFQGTPEGNEDRGRSMMSCFNRLGFTAVVVGNHEYDFGEKNLAALIALARYPVLGANIVERENPSLSRPYVRMFVVKRVGGIRVALVGLIASETKRVSTGPFGAAAFPDEIQSLRKLWPTLKKAADEIVLISHCGLSIDRKLAKAFPRVRLILGGHSHTPLPRGLREGSTWIAQSGGKGTTISRVTLTVDQGKHRLGVERVELVDITQPVTADSATMGFLAATFDHIGAKWDTPIGKVVGAPDRRVRGSGRSTPVGNYVADLIRRTAKADVGLTNKGGLRSRLPQGTVTRRHVFELLPFDNSVHVMQMTGRQLSAVLSQGLRPGHLPLEISGADYSYAVVEGRRELRKVEVAGRTIKPKQLYRVATSSFLASGGDDFTIFESVESAPVGPDYLRAILLTELRNHGQIRLLDESRIRLVE